jgi:hypothetical protein
MGETLLPSYTRHPRLLQAAHWAKQRPAYPSAVGRRFFLNFWRISDMYPHIIQFDKLEDLVAELPADHIVRAVALDVTEGTYEKVVELRIAGIGVHVRTINEEGHILSSTLPVASI